MATKASERIVDLERKVIFQGLQINDLKTENERLLARVTELETAGQEIYTQLGYFMESDNCDNDPSISWPDVCEEGCTHCSAEYDRDVWRKAMEASE